MLRIAVIGTDEQEARSAGKRLHGALVEPCPADITAEPLQSAEAVAFVSPAPPDPDAVGRVLSTGKHVLLATEHRLPAEELARLAELARQYGVVLQIASPDRALPSWRLIKQQLDNEKLGQIGLIRICRGEPGTGSDVGLPASLANDLDLALWLVGRPPDTVYGVERDGQQPGERCVQVHLGFPGGGMALVTHTNIWTSQDAQHSISIIAASGAAYAGNHQNRQLLFAEGPVTAPQADEGSALALLLSDFANEVRAGTSDVSSILSAQQLEKVIAAVELSLSSRDAARVECP